MINIKSLLKSGESEKNTDLINKKIKIANLVSVFSFPLSLGAILIGIIIVDIGTIVSFISVCIAFILVPIMNFYGLTTQSRVFISAALSIIVVVPTYFVGDVMLGHLFAYSYAIIGIAMIPTILFDFNTEKRIIYPLVLLQFFYLLTFDLMLLANLSGKEQELYSTMYIQIKMAQAILFAFVVGLGLMLSKSNVK